MVLLLTAEETRRAEAAAFSAGMSSFSAMRRAGNSVAEAVLARWPRRRVDQVLVLCGPGNNGGDGFVAAARLREAGWPVTTACLTGVERLTGDAAQAAREWGATPIPATPRLIADLTRRSLVIDALFGIGLTRALRDQTADIVAAVNRSPARVVAADIPSGIDADSGQTLGAAIVADLTVTFGWPKRGHLLLPGRDHTGELLIASIGMGASCLEAIHPSCSVNSPEIWIGRYPSPATTDHKYSRGHLVIAGGRMAGAARLAAAGARQIGTGLVTIWAAPARVEAYAGIEPGVILRSDAGIENWRELVGNRNVDAVVTGCGHEPDEETRNIVAAALASKKPVVVDGGGLSAFAGDPARLIDAIDGITVLTPHGGEFDRLFPDLGAGSKIDKAVAAAKRCRAIVVLKGSDTVIAEPGGEALVAEGSPSTLASAGSGDVLAGMVGGLLALGIPAWQASGIAVWLHGAAARRLGCVLTAEALTGELPPALAETLRWR